MKDVLDEGIASTFLCNACMHSVCLDVDAANQMKDFSQSLVAVSLFASNYYFGEKVVTSMQLQKKSLYYIRGA